MNHISLGRKPYRKGEEGRRFSPSDILCQKREKSAPGERGLGSKKKSSFGIAHW